MDSVAVFIQHYQGLLVGLVGSGLLLWLWRRILNPMWRLVKAQLNPNGGESLVDLASEIKPNHAKAELHWKALEENQEKVKQDLATARTELREAIEGVGERLGGRVGDLEGEMARREAFARAAFQQLPEEQRKWLETLYRDTGPQQKAGHL